MMTFRVLVVVSTFAMALPSGAEVMGWRGDGSGRYPAANPPTVWGRAAKDLTELSAQAQKPADDAVPAKEDAVPDGVIRNWLVLGPVPLADDAKAEDAIPDAAALAPEENVKVGDLAWRTVTLDTDCMDLCRVLKVSPEKKGVAAYAHTYIHSPSGKPIAYNLMTQGQGCYRVWLNGAQVYFSGRKVDIGPGCRLVLPLRKGWNRLLILNARTMDTRRSWWIRGALFGNRGTEYDSHGIVWMTPTPSPGASAPVIAGDRMFFTSETGSLSCVNKADGKLLWMRTLTYYDFVTDEERKANPKIFAELDPIAEQLKQADQTEIVMPWKLPRLEKDMRWSLETPLIRKMARVSRERYGNPATWGCEAGYTACNPVTDGELVYALFGTGIIACYDRDGNCKWKRVLKHGTVEHGYTTSPLLVDGKLVVYFDNFTVLDAKTGDVIAERPHFTPKNTTPLSWYTHFHATGCVLPAGNEKFLSYLSSSVRRTSSSFSLFLSLAISLLILRSSVPLLPLDT